MRASELIAAVSFACANLKNPDDLFKGDAALPLAAINDAPPEGKTLLASARRILANLGKADVRRSASRTSPTRSASSPTPPSTATASSSRWPPTTRRRARSSTTSSSRSAAVPDRSGKPGIDPALIDAFFAEARAYDAWYGGEASAATSSPRPRRTAAAAAAVAAIAQGRRLLRALPARRLRPARAAGAQPRRGGVPRPRRADLSLTAEEVAGFPLALVGGGRPLPLAGARQPGARGGARGAARRRGRAAARRARGAHRGRLARARRQARAVRRLARRQGRRRGSRRSASRACARSSPRAQPRRLADADRARQGARARGRRIEHVERLVRYHRDLGPPAAPTSSTSRTSTTARRAGHLPGRHALPRPARLRPLPARSTTPPSTPRWRRSPAPTSRTCDCARKGTGEKMPIVAAFTGGDSDNLMVGRNGVFYDRKGRDWDATITKIVDNPISIRQAFWSPYKKFVRAASRSRSPSARPPPTASRNAHARPPTADDRGQRSTRPSRREPAAAKIDVGTVAALGVAVGAIGTFVDRAHRLRDGVLRARARWRSLGRLRRLMLLISVPSVVLAYLKLRKRNLGPDPRRQRLGDQRAREDQRAVRRDAHQRRQVAAGLAARSPAIPTPSGASPGSRIVFVGLAPLRRHAWWKG